MRVATVVLTWNPTEHDRLGLLDQTCVSLAAEADEIIVVDNGSTDGTDLSGYRTYRNTNPNTTSGYGTWTCLRVGAGTGADIVVVSDDDMVWQPGWRDELEAFWFDAPDDILLAGGHLEPAFPWNDIRKVHDGWVERESTGAASWTTTNPSLLAEIGAMWDLTTQGKWDVYVCRLARSFDYRIAQLDLAEHVGSVSTWGNQTIEYYGWAVEPIRDLIR